MADQTTEPSESTSQELRGVIDTGDESFAVDGIDEIAEVVGTKEGGGTSAAEEKPGEKPGAEKPTEKKEDTAPASEEGDGKKEEAGEKPEEKPSESEEELPKGIKKRLATITRKRHDAERASANLQAQNAELLSRIEALEHPGTQSEGEPQIENFDTEEEYLEAVTDWKVDQKFAEREATLQAEWEEKDRAGQEAVAQGRQEAFRTELEEGVKKFEDFETVIEDLNITGDMIHILESLPNIPEVVYKLGNSPDTVAELVGMPFLQVAYKMKTMSNDLAKKKSTKAPAPVRPVSTTGGAIKSLESMSMREYSAYRDRQDKERKGMV